MLTGENLIPPSFDAIRRGDKDAVEHGIKVVWDGLLSEIRERAKGLTKTLDRFDKKVLDLAPSANTNNLNYQKAGILQFTGSSSVNLTGIIAPERDGAMLILHNTGSGTITLKHQDANSDAANRFSMASGADRSLATNSTLIIGYLASRWRDFNFQ